MDNELYAEAVAAMLRFLNVEGTFCIGDISEIEPVLRTHIEAHHQGDGDSAEGHTVFVIGFPTGIDRQELKRLEEKTGEVIREQRLALLKLVVTNSQGEWYRFLISTSSEEELKGLLTALIPRLSAE